MGSLSPVAGYIRRVHLLGSARPSPQVRVRRIRDFGFIESSCHGFAGSHIPPWVVYMYISEKILGSIFFVAGLWGFL